MKLLIFLLFPFIASSQVLLPDTLYFGTPPFTKVVVYRNASTTTVSPTLVSGTTIKTYNGESILGSGNILLPTALQIGLGNVNNTTDASKNSASAVLTNKTISTFNYAADAGANDTYVISLSPSPGSYTTGMVIFFKANTVNTGAASINVNGLGAKTIVKRVNTVLANGDIPALGLCMIIYDGTNFCLLNPVVN